MKTLSSLLLVCLSLLLTLPARAAGRETRSVSAFTEIALANSVRVVVVQGSPQQVEVEGDAADLAHLETVVESSRLKISTVRESAVSYGYRFRSAVVVYVTTPTINALSVSGSGTLKAAAGVKTSRLDLSLSGSGRLDVGPVQVQQLHASLSGSGALAVGPGSVEQADVRISGSGNLRAAALQTGTARVRISGSGNCYLSVSQTLDASIAGSGNVYVSGNPKISSTTAGSGRVRRS